MRTEAIGERATIANRLGYADVVDGRQGFGTISGMPLDRKNGKIPGSILKKIHSRTVECPQEDDVSRAVDCDVVVCAKKL